jgi:phospholipid/cholesterol/gamma-HCH transport system permease protein
MPRSDETLIGPVIDRRLAEVADNARFAGRFFVEVFRPPLHLREVLRLCHDVGVKTLPLVLLTGFITGIVFTKQSRPSLVSFGATSWLPSLVSIGLIRSLAPLVTALLCAGKIGSSIGAELGSMKVTEQIEAMEVSAIDPFRYLVVTRTLATTMMIPVLTCYFAIVGLLGSFLNVYTNEGTAPAAFLDSAFSDIGWIDVGGAGLRALAFGFTIGIVSCREGFRTGRGTQGVGRAANAAVVKSMLIIFLEEVAIVQLLTALAQV